MTIRGQSHGRFSHKSLSFGSDQDPTGRIFISSAGTSDLSGIEICGVSVDTVYQIYRGIVNIDVYEKVLSLSESVDGNIFFDGPSCPVGYIFTDGQWHVGKVGKVSGYHLKLQNNALGIVVLLKNAYSEVDKEGSHLKIKLSHHFIRKYGYGMIQEKMDEIASIFLKSFIPSGVAVHLAADVEGWQPPVDFMERFVTHSRTVRRYDGINSLEFEDLSDISVTYGDGKTMMFGKAGSLQVAIYNKGDEIIKSDKVDYYHTFWDEYTGISGSYEHSIWRVELRFHHSVVREIGNGFGSQFDSWNVVYPYLTDFWKYGLKRNRLDYNSTYIDPFWQLLIEDVVFVKVKGIEVKRKKKEDPSGIQKNISLIIGNLITLYAREGFNADDVMVELRKLSFWPLVVRSYEMRGKSISDIKQQIAKGLCYRRLIGRAA
ncbi:MAG: hypothetical protein H7833_08485 [Magnetococcus sp. DMHC-1]